MRASASLAIGAGPAGDRIRAATRLEFANVAVLLGGKIETRAFGGDAGPWVA